MIKTTIIISTMTMKVVSMKGFVGGWVGEEGRGKGLGQTFGDW